MIDLQAVTDALLDRLRSAGDTIGDGTAPAERPVQYGVLEFPPGGSRTGTMAAPEAHALVRCRIRAVARSEDPAVARKAAQHLGHRLTALLMDRTVPIAGPGWSITGRTMLGDGGSDGEGPIVNHTDDFEFFVTPASA